MPSVSFEYYIEYPAYVDFRNQELDIARFNQSSRESMLASYGRLVDSVFKEHQHAIKIYVQKTEVSDWEVVN